MVAVLVKLVTVVSYAPLLSLFLTSYIPTSLSPH